MATIIENKILHIGGMTCVSCANKIEKKLLHTAGIKNAKVSFEDVTAKVSYDTDVISLNEITKVIEKLNYTVLAEKEKENHGKIISAVIMIFAIYIIMKHLGLSNLFYQFPEAEKGMEYGMLFFIGLLTSVHCIAMCGGINLSQCMPKGVKEGEQSRLSALRPSVLYNLGRVISYTMIGGIVGTLGSVVSFSGWAKGMIQIAAGIFMVIMGLNMLQIFPGLHKLTPRIPKAIAIKIYKKKNGSNSPLYVGLLNGLMPCGPLQAMQLYALSTGSPVKGALSMFLFSLGTVPLMFGLGALSSVLSQKFTKKVMTVGAVLVVILGISMFSSGMSLSNLSIPANNNSQSSTAQTEIIDGVQNVTTTLASGRYEPIRVQAGTPVKWTIKADPGTINGCNNRLIIPEYEIEKQLEVGENVITFTPTQTGEFQYSCWMGMIRSTITVTEDS